MIALLCPSRARPKQCLRMMDSASETLSNKHVVRGFLAISQDDLPLYETSLSDLILPDGMPTGYKWNMLAHKAMEYTGHKLFMLASDDMIFATPLWDEAIISHYNKLENKIHVYALCDSRDPDGTPHPIVTREWIEAMGYFLPPIFLHWYVDSWTVEIAKANGCFTHMKDYLLVHDKPSDKGQADETHNRIREMGWRERDAYVAKTCAGFLEGEKMRLHIAMQKVHAA